MEKEFVTHTQALRLHELGFDEPCFAYYVDGEIRGVNLGIKELEGVEPYYERFGFHILSNHDIFNSNKIVVTAPTLSQGFRWFRKKYGYWSYVKESTKGMCRFYIDKFEKHSFISAPYRLDEEAELACLDTLIEIVESKSE